MGQKAITIYTPEGAAPHITAEDDAFIYGSFYSVTSGLMGGLTCTRIDNNTVQLSGGGVMNRGHILRIPDGETLSLTVESGTAGYNRYDSVVAEFIKGGGADADTYRIKVITGTPSGGTPLVPSPVKSNLLNKGDNNQIEMFRLLISGTAISSIQQVAASLPQVPNISYGTTNPGGGNDGDIYFKITG